ncbi:trypsin-like peptidase domain-containing protein [Desulfobulbus sp. US4]|nr:trypsin-like peptidase domain-containing protein [Desulfobulbus sp. US4]
MRKKSNDTVLYMSTPPPSSSLVRIWSHESEKIPFIAGAGFIVTPEHVLTCAHVINSALGRDKDDQRTPNTLVFFDFLGSYTPKIKAEVVRWFPVCENSESDQLEDIAVLRFIEPLPDEVSPISLAAPNEQTNRLKMCGFPRYAPGGTYVTAILQGAIKNGSIELHPEEGRTVDPGFSGTAAWNIKQHVVCGMIVSRLMRADGIYNVYMIPAEKLVKVVPDISLKRIQEHYNAARYLKVYQTLSKLCHNNKKFNEFTVAADSILSRYNEIEQNIRSGNLPLTESRIQKEQVKFSYHTLMRKMTSHFGDKNQNSCKEKIISMKKNYFELDEIKQHVEDVFLSCTKRADADKLFCIKNRLDKVMKCSDDIIQQCRLQ